MHRSFVIRFAYKNWLNQKMMTFRFKENLGLNIDLTIYRLVNYFLYKYLFTNMLQIFVVIDITIITGNKFQRKIFKAHKAQKDLTV